RPIFVLWFVYSMFLSVILFWILQNHLPKSIVFVFSVILYFVGYVAGRFVGIDSFLKPLVGLCQNFVFLDLGFLFKCQILRKDKPLIEFFLTSLSCVALFLLNL